MISRLRTGVGKFLRISGRVLPDRIPDNTKIFSSFGAHVYFGYYDVSPFGADGSKILATRTMADNVSPHDSGDTLDVGYYHLNSPDQEFIKIGESRAWNWQQGCRLQWVPNPAERILYNNFDGKRFVTCVYDVCGRKNVRTLDMPVYAVSPQGDFALGLDFSLLHQNRRGYGYSNSAAGQFDPAVAVYKISLNGYGVSNLFSMNDIRNSVGGAPYDCDYINHLSYAPDGQHFLFFYIRVIKQKRVTYLFVASADGSGLKHIAAGYSPSHYAWRDDGMLLLTAQKRETKLMKYLLVDAKANSNICINHNGLDVDGHPTFINSSVFISDTYPSRLGHQTLFTDSINRAERQEIASFYLPPSFSGEKRCDLHPRLSHCKKFVCVDIIRDGRRAMAVVPIKDYIS